MKRLFSLAAFMLVITLGSSFNYIATAQNNDYYDRGDVTYQTFYDELSPYGRWVENPDYGYVWVPDVDQDFRPYSTNGHWVWTDNYEWMWVSDYDWGWAPFHYGRWEEDAYYGWIWVPGYEWSPAWVAWRDGGDYYGWAPLRPGVNISINFNIGGYNPPYNYWSFVPRRHITSPRIYDYYIDRRQNVTIINYTTIIVNNYSYGNNYGFRSGPRRYDAERYCGRINPVRFRDSYSPGRTFYRNNEVSVYRPNVRRDDNRNYSPRQFDRYDRRDGDLRSGRNENDFRRNNNGNSRINETPVRREFERRNENSNRAPQENVERRKFDRNDNTVRQPDRTERTDDRRINNRPFERPNRNTPNLPGNNGNNDNRRFERRSDENRGTTPPVRQPQAREFNNGNQRPPQQHFERRTEVRQPVNQQPGRQIERRDNGNNGSRQQGSQSDNNGNKRGRF